ncbi:SH3 domain-containing protein [Helicobacter cetorum]|uniref:SH3 domain-containing protein n=1 Tax=Helicobacter cetorum TaxID=138563 RepID=UPI000CF09BC1|nr:SH3 domain-containing protein [Helicobacter cetorum]
MNFFFRLYAQPLLVLIAFLLGYVLVYMGGVYATKQTSKTLEVVETPAVENTPTHSDLNIDKSIEQKPLKETPIQGVAPSQNQSVDESDHSIDATPNIENSQVEIKENALEKPQENMHILGDYAVIPSSVNVRALPSTRGKVIGGLLKDQSVQVLEIKNDWAKIQFSSSMQGYVFFKLLKKITHEETLH